MSDTARRAAGTKTTFVRALLAAAGIASLAWCVAVIPALRSEPTVVEVANAVLAGETFKPDVLARIDAQAPLDGELSIRPSLLSRYAIIRLRLADIAMAGNDAALKQAEMRALDGIVDRALSDVPGDAFLWAARFWIASVRGASADGLLSLSRSYDLGPNEGWIGTKRDAAALASYSALPADLAERAIAEFVSLVRWGFVAQATEIAAGAPVQLRRVLFSRLIAVDDEQRGAFARVFYMRELDEVPVPGFPPPTPHMNLPVLPPDL